ncbi:hypothetical protein COT97_01170 [Candidatus Falkowbacteria bacterium CG10_big_fil_rev_8_21_14_0_10_39_11]|uniref:LysM domain-containing protein n=1 Tax=Candidatus Falkowbacteria bacterium CG10_big_fil_rev_8_21_14_0_10_39_11 TaxID=1974565 RepID=A0A2H0V5U8_9BACT|nr:MAG: hypothetical protein COT97_01170 [Candidatus Falkowbacteria bacterium CG10_big_fil_rev_8_21_14_0_10_39_11]
MSHINKNALKLVIFIIRGLKKILNLSKKGLTYVGRPFSVIIDKLARYTLIPLYRIYNFFKRRFLGFVGPARSRVFAILTKKYIVHVLIVVMSLFVFVGNISAKETRAENFGEQTVVYGIFNNEERFQLVEEKATVNPEEKVLSYLDTGSQINSRSLILDDNSVTEEQLAEGLSSVTSGGSAIVKPNITETEISIASRNQTVEHNVASGETISTIAKRYNVSINTILWANNLTERSVIKPGMSLTVLPVSGVQHQVARGDTVQSLALKYSVESEKITSYNNLSEDGQIVIGQDLIIPGGERPAPTIVSRSTNQYAAIPDVSLSKILQPTTLETAPRGSSVGTGKMVWPTTWRVITQYFSWRHAGLDIDGDYSSPILAADAGVVTRVGWGNGYGNMVMVDHGNGIVTLYAHLSKFHVTQGQTVSRGQSLGMMGTTGWSTGTHLHFEVRVNGVKKNPLSYIQ